MWSCEILHYLSKADCHNKIFPRPQANDDLAKNISRAGSDYTRDNLMANDVFCYHVKVFLEFAKRAKEAPGVLDGMEEVKRDSNEHRDMPCDCLRGKKKAGVKSQKTELWERNFEWDVIVFVCVFLGMMAKKVEWLIHVYFAVEYFNSVKMVSRWFSPCPSSWKATH